MAGSSISPAERVRCVKCKREIQRITAFRIGVYPFAARVAFKDPPHVFHAHLCESCAVAVHAFVSEP